MIDNSRARMLIALFSLLLPWVLKKYIFKKLLGYQVDNNAWIGFSLVAVKSLRMGDSARIGHLNICKGLNKLELANFSSIGHLNWISGNEETPMLRAQNKTLSDSSLIIGAHGAITRRHFIDCSDRVEVGEFTTIAGIRSQVLTHSINIELNQQQASPVYIGRYCFIGTGSILLAGSSIPDYCVLAAGSVLCDEQKDVLTLYAGVPAKKKKELSKESLYFKRTRGYVD